jgi:4-hydroxybenzoate polyprenyltransferase
MNQNDIPERGKALHPSENDSPRFGRLLLVLLFAVALIVAITFATEAYYT